MAFWWLIQLLRAIQFDSTARPYFSVSILWCNALSNRIKGFALLFTIISTSVLLRHVHALIFFRGNTRFLWLSRTLWRVFMELEFFINLLLLIKTGSALSRRCRIASSIKHIAVGSIRKRGLALIPAPPDISDTWSRLKYVSILLFLALWIRLLIPVLFSIFMLNLLVRAHRFRSWIVQSLLDPVAWWNSLDLSESLAWGRSLLACRWNSGFFALVESLLWLRLSNYFLLCLRIWSCQVALASLMMIKLL